jgi:hypothetical protein
MLVKCGVSLKVEQPVIQLEDSSAILTTPLQLQVFEIKAITASKLNQQWHSRLPVIHWSNIVRNTHYVCYGIYFKGNAVGVAIWSSPVAQNRFKNGKEILELRRLALSDKCPKNTASRVLSIMVKLIRNKFPDIKRLISYQDLDVHKGTIYKASGWVVKSENEFIDWNSDKRKRNKSQAVGRKVRWEKYF